MINDIIKNSVRFILLLLLQVVVVQHIHLGPFIILYPYVLFILVLPFDLPKLVVLLLAFVTGLTVDIFYDTAGLHASVCTIIGFARFYLLKLLAPRDGYEIGMTPTYQSMGPTWFIAYSGILIFIHHLFLFYLELFGFSEFFTTLLRVVLSAIGTFLFCFIIQFLLSKNSNRS